MKKKKLFVWIVAAVMVFSVLTPMTDFAFAASNTKSDGTYGGKLPKLPNAIAEQAIKCAWPYKTAMSKYSYEGGDSKEEYKDALQLAYGDRSSWSKQTRAGVSCDVFVGTVVRSSGYDKSYPRGLDEQYKYAPKSSKFKRLSITNVKDFQPGDIVLYNKKAGGGHTAIYVEFGEKGYLAQAQYKQKLYPVLNDPKSKYDTSNYSFYGVFRATERCQAAITRGGYSDDIKLLQEFLNWAGFDCGKADGSFGEKTEKALIAFQKAANLEADGKCGSKTLEAAKTFVPTKVEKKETKPKETKATKSKYTGKFPTKVVNKKKGSKTNIKRWQNFLKWYGYPVKATGKFNSTTVKYTKKFQKKYKLEVDGSVGPKTVKKAKSVTK